MPESVRRVDNNFHICEDCYESSYGLASWGRVHSLRGSYEISPPVPGLEAAARLVNGRRSNVWVERPEAPSIIMDEDNFLGITSCYACGEFIAWPARQSTIDSLILTPSADFTGAINYYNLNMGVCPSCDGFMSADQLQRCMALGPGPCDIIACRFCFNACATCHVLICADHLQQCPICGRGYCSVAHLNAHACNARRRSNRLPSYEFESDSLIIVPKLKRVRPKLPSEGLRNNVPRPGVRNNE